MYRLSAVAASLLVVGVVSSAIPKAVAAGFDTGTKTDPNGNVTVTATQTDPGAVAPPPPPPAGQAQPAPTSPGGPAAAPAPALSAEELLAVQKGAEEARKAQCAAAGDAECAKQISLPPGAPPPAPGAPAAPPPPPVVTEAMVRSAALKMQLPTATPMVGPDPSWNEWGMAAVGYPLWLWTEAAPATSTVTENGITITLKATPSGTTFALGNGATKACATTTPYDRATSPGTASPTCGYSYPAAGSYAVSATTTWSVAWSANGKSGTITVDRTASRQLEVGELETVVTG